VGRGSRFRSTTADEKSAAGRAGDRYRYALVLSIARHRLGSTRRESSGSEAFAKDRMNGM
jgi:hypothetical protein